MPTIPVYNGGQQAVQTAPLPGPRFNPDAPPGAFGGATGPNLEPLTREATQIFNEERQKANEVAFTAADSHLSQLETDLLYNPQVLGALTKHGSDAFDMPRQVRDVWQKGADQIAAGLTNDEQRAAFARAVASRAVDLDAAVQRHVAGERQQFDAQTTQGYVENERNAALANYQDDDRVQLSIARQSAALQGLARRNGLPTEWTQAQIADATSKTRLAVIQLMASKDDIRTNDYFTSHASDLQGQDKIEAERTVEESTTRGESQRQADAIIASTSDRMSALNAVKQIADPKVRDLTEQRVDQYWNEKKQAEQEDRQNTFIAATNLLDKNPGANPRFVIPPAMWQKFTPEERVALVAYGENDQPNDDQRWLKFLDLRPQELGAINQAQFTTDYWSHFDKQHRERAAEQWAAARDAVAAGKLNQNPKLASTMDFNQRFENTMRRSNLIPVDKPLSKMNKDQAKQYADLQTEAAHRIEQYELTQLGGKRPATGDEMQQIIDNLVKERVFVDRPWRFDVEKPAIDVTTDEVGHTYVPMERIAVPDQARIQRWITAQGAKSTPDKIQRVYAAFLLGNQDLAKSIAMEGYRAPAAPSGNTTPRRPGSPNASGLGTAKTP